MIVTAPQCEVELNQPGYVNGEMVVASVVRFTNPGAETVAVELKRWLGTTVATETSIINTGADGSFLLPPGADIDLGPAPFLSVTAGFPRGTYELSCRMLDPVTGALLAEDRNPFELE